MVSCCITLWIPEENRKKTSTSIFFFICSYYLSIKDGLWAQKSYQISWRVLPAHNRPISFVHLPPGLPFYSFFSSPSGRCGGLQTEHPGCVCVSCVCVCPSRLIHSASSSPCVSAGSSSSSRFWNGASWANSILWLLVLLSPSLCYSVLYAVYPHRSGWYFGSLFARFDYPKNFYYTGKYYHPSARECLLRSVCCLHHFRCLSVYIQACCGLLRVMALASRVSSVPWHQNRSLCAEQKQNLWEQFFLTFGEDLEII